MTRSSKLYNRWALGGTYLETVWIVRSDKTVETIRDELKSYVGSDDQIFILDITGDKAEWVGINEAGNMWLKENIDRECSSPTDDRTAI